MFGGRKKTIKAQDILILLKLLAMEEKSWRIIDLAQDLELSPSEISIGLERLRISGLISPDKRKVHKAAVLEFLIHGLKYVFPAEYGPLQRGIPTAHSFIIFNQKIMNDDKIVWPSEEGDMRGSSISPIYETAPKAALKDQKLHQLLALVDSIRIGRVREQQLAQEQLRRELTLYEL